jgi:hypothetical protein
VCHIWKPLLCLIIIIGKTQRYVMEHSHIVRKNESLSSSSVRVELVSQSFLKYQAIFFLAFLDHVFLSVDNIKVVREVFFIYFLLLVGWD